MSLGHHSRQQRHPRSPSSAAGPCPAHPGQPRIARGKRRPGSNPAGSTHNPGPPSPKLRSTRNRRSLTAPIAPSHPWSLPHAPLPHTPHSHTLDRSLTSRTLTPSVPLSHPALSHPQSHSPTLSPTLTARTHPPPPALRHCACAQQRPLRMRPPPRTASPSGGEALKGPAHLSAGMGLGNERGTGPRLTGRSGNGEGWRHGERPRAQGTLGERNREWLQTWGTAQA